MKQELNNLIDLLELILSEKLDCGLAEPAFYKLCWNELPGLELVYTNLHHYWNDRDIKDAAYREFQNAELRKLITHLRNGDFRRASGVSFLHES
jgi:hypothetical protein